MLLSIDHETVYTYDVPVRLSTQYLRLTPRDNPRQRVIEWHLDTPMPAMRTTDGYGNILHVLTIDKPTSEIRIRANGLVETAPVVDEPSDFHGVTLSPLLFLRPTRMTRIDSAVAGFAEPFRRRSGTLSGLRELAAGVHARLPLVSSDDAGARGAGAALEAGRASCHDHAHLFIACCRHLGVPARYASGYMHTAEHEPGAVAVHAWAEAWLVDRWRSFDVTHRCPIGEAHIKLAVGADYLDACPMRGVRTGGGLETLASSAQLNRQS